MTRFTTRLKLIAAALIAAILLSAAPARAADQFPSRMITLVVPLTPGTTIDILARLYADKLSQILGQQVVVLNKPGAGGAIGGENVANAAPDGYTHPVRQFRPRHPRLPQSRACRSIRSTALPASP